MSMIAVEPLALYVHIPFCTAKCTYCDFNSYAGQDSLMSPYSQAVAREAELWAGHLAGRRVETVFFGGGTPSLLPLPEMQIIMKALQERFDIDPGAEVTLEANPGTVDATHLGGLRRMGFNRISFGVQSFHDEELRTLERIHDAEEVDQAYSWAREQGFENINLDLIYGLAGQTLAGWQFNLERALAMGPEHLSLYALTLEDGTPLTRDVNRGRAEGPDLDLQADMFEWSVERMRRSGYSHYEVSNWSKSGRKCHHNLFYWHNRDWLGLGAGAHSHLNNQRFAGAASPSRYIALTNESVAQEGEPLEGMRQVSIRDEANQEREMSETAFLALRLREGLNIAAFESRFGVKFEQVFGKAMRETQSLGLTELSEGHLRLRDEAVLLGDEAFLRFLSPDGAKEEAR